MYNENISEVEEICERFSTYRVIVEASLLPINVIGSVLVLRAIHITNEVNNISTFKFIANLAIIDIVIAIFGCPLLITMHYHWTLGELEFETVKTIFYVIFMATRLASALTLIALSLDKVFACIFHLKYENYMTMARICSVIKLIWLLSATVSALQWIEDDKHREKRFCQPYRNVTDTIINVLLLVCFCIVLGSNVYLMFLSKEHRKQEWMQRRETIRKNKKIYENYKSIRSLALLLCMYGIGLLPLVSYTLIRELIGCNSATCTKVTEYLTIIHYLDMNTRFVIYCCRFKSLRTSILRVIGCGRPAQNQIAPQRKVGIAKVNGAANITFVDEAQNGKISDIVK